MICLSVPFLASTASGTERNVQGLALKDYQRTRMQAGSIQIENHSRITTVPLQSLLHGQAVDFKIIVIVKCLERVKSAEGGANNL